MPSPFIASTETFCPPRQRVVTNAKGIYQQIGVIGKTISHYRVVEELGGGMGVVYKAEDHGGRQPLCSGPMVAKAK